MDFRIIELPAFEAVSSGVDPEFDFSAKGALGRFNAFFRQSNPSRETALDPEIICSLINRKTGLFGGGRSRRAWTTAALSASNSKAAIF